MTKLDQWLFEKLSFSILLRYIPAKHKTQKLNPDLVFRLFDFIYSFSINEFRLIEYLFPIIIIILFLFPIGNSVGIFDGMSYLNKIDHEYIILFYQNNLFFISVIFIQIEFNILVASLFVKEFYFYESTYYMKKI